MWQKVKNIWVYTSDHYLEDYDFFRLDRGDLYMIVENMGCFLPQHCYPHDTKLFFGRPVPRRDIKHCILAFKFDKY